MSINITKQPPVFQPVLANGLFYTISADTTDKFKFRYTYDLYVNGESVFQGKATPNPNDLGVIDVSRILKTYVDNSVIANWNNTPIYAHQTFPFSRPYLDETIYYQTFFGYEYADSELSPVTGFTGLGVTGDTQGNPSVPSQIGKVFQSTMGVNGRATQQDFDMGPFVLSGTPQGVNPTTTGLFLTNSPRYRNIQASEYYTLAFTNYYLTQSTLSEPYYAEYKFYNDIGLLITAVTVDNITVNGGGPRPNATSVYQSYIGLLGWGDTEYQTLYVGAGPQNIAPIMPPNAAQYTVQLFGKFTGTTSPLVPSATPTPTPSVTPRFCTCRYLEVENTSQTSYGVLNYLDCDKVNRTLFIEPTATYEVCICNPGDYSIVGPLVAGVTGFCPGPSPTPTPSQLQCICEQGTIYNPNSFLIVVDSVDCDGNGFSIPVGAFDTVVTNCVCSNRLTSGSNFIFTPTASCNPSVTQTPTPTPTPTFVQGPQVWIVGTCDYTCLDGICFCGNPTSITLYTPFGTNITDDGVQPYLDANLTLPFYGYFQKNGIIYDTTGGFGVQFVCTVGDGC